MIVRELSEEEKDIYNQAVNHPCQSWEWGEFRKKMGRQVIRLGVFKKEKLVSAYQLSIHNIPFTNLSVGYLPRGPMIDRSMLESLQKIGHKKNIIFFRIEPNVEKKEVSGQRLGVSGLVSAARPFFYKYTFMIDLTKDEGELLQQMKQKTRYNLRLAQKHGVKVSQDNSDQAFKIYLKLLEETTRRQGFFAHTQDYHRQMWRVLAPAGMAHLLKAEYQGEILAVWVLFKFKDVLYYPYGASSSAYRQLMANNLMMWEAIKLGKKMGGKIFDLWGCLGPNPDPKDPWYGFHRFKEGYGGQLVELVGSFDLVLNPRLYQFYNLADSLRWKVLGLKSRIYESAGVIKKFFGFK